MFHNLKKFKLMKTKKNFMKTAGGGGFPRLARVMTLAVMLLTLATTGAWAQTEESESMTTATAGTYTYTGTHFTVTENKTGSDFATGNGLIISHIPAGNGSVTIAALNGENITKVELNYYSTAYYAEYLSSTAGTVSSDGKSITGINASTVTISNSVNAFVRVKSWKIYYTMPEPPTKYTVTMAEGTVDAKNWSIASGEKSAKGDAADGLTGLSEGDQVTIQYTGRLKVKGVKATSDAAAASVPDGALSGVFSVSSTKKVYFSKGNLRYASSKWSFFDNQYDYYTSHSADAWDHFGWSTSATDYGKNTSTTRSDYSGDFVDWGATMGTGWRTLTSDEWTYLLKTRSASTVGGTENGRYAKAKVNDVKGVILFPDTYTHPDGVTAPTGVNATDATGWNGNSYTAADWTKMETAGCVFLPAAGYRNGSSVNNPGSCGDYSSATPSGTDKAYELYFSSSSLNPASLGSRFYGLSVRLVSEVTTSDAPATKEPATVTTAPTGAAIVGVKKTTALVSGGVAEGGTLQYAVTTENTKPTSTDGFSEAVPTAQTITASGTVYVWYYVKGDDTHSDSEISATAIEVTVKAVPITVTWNASDIVPENSWDESFTKDGITITAVTCDFETPTFGGGGTFTTTIGNFTKIEISADFVGDVSGTGWSNDGWQSATWTGNAASVSFSGAIWGGGMTCEGGNLTIVFTIE